MMPHHSAQVFNVVQNPQATPASASPLAQKTRREHPAGVVT
jgi:hypothetical protein